MAEPKYSTVTGGYAEPAPRKYSINQHFADLSDKAAPSFLGSEGLGQERFDTGLRPSDIGYLPELRAINQTGWGQLGNAIAQAGAEVVGGTIEGMGYLLDVGSYGDLIAGTEQEFGNAISDFGKMIKEQTREELPIYTDFEPGSFAPGLPR